MISIAKKRWDEIPEISSKDISSDLLSIIGMIYNSLEEHKRYAYVLEMDFGDFVIHEGTINRKLLTGHETENLFKDISYSEDPLALVIHNQIEVYTINRCEGRRRIIKEKVGKSENSVEDIEYVVPLNTIVKGDFYGVFGTLDYLSNIEIPSDHGMDWFAVSGLSSFIFDFPFFYSIVSIRKDFSELFSQYKASREYYPGKEQMDFFKKLLPDYKTRVIYFPVHIFNVENTQLRDKLHYYLLIKGWSQYSPLRNAAFENKVLADILKNISLNNDTEFMLKLYDYLRNVFSGNTKILRPLKPNENHFLNDAIRNFKNQCKDYFNESKKHILPLCYIYDRSNIVKVGILSMTSLPILKNYRYTNLKDVVADLVTINKEFKNNEYFNYTFDLGRISAFGGIDRYNPKKINYDIKGSCEFRKLISSLFNVEESKILPTSGQFKNAIALTIN